MRVRSANIWEIQSSRFAHAVRQETGLSADDLLRMTMTLSRVETLAGSRQTADLLSVDIDAVEMATRVGWSDPALGRHLLLELKSGNVTPETVLAMLDTRRANTALTVHEHWSSFDKDLELLEMTRLQVLLARGELISNADFDRLVRLSAFLRLRARRRR